MKTHELVPAIENPRNWKYTWESNSHVPIIRLYLFNPNTKPSAQCINLTVSILFDKSLLQLTWLHNNQPRSLWVPIPRVLIDVESPISFRALDDHIEVKILLVLPIDHPIVSSFDFEGAAALEDDEVQPLQLDSGIISIHRCCVENEIDFTCLLVLIDVG